VNNEQFEKTETVVATLRQAIAEAEKPIYVDSSRFPKDQLDHKPGMVIVEPVHAIDISQECVDETAKYRHDLVYRLRKRAEIRRQIPDRKSVQEGQPDRIADLLEEAADALAEAKLKEKNT
jgi:signal recognition particle subunit SEC65